MGTNSSSKQLDLSSWKQMPPLWKLVILVILAILVILMGFGLNPI